jgi:hypothetical protein
VNLILKKHCLAILETLKPLDKALLLSIGKFCLLWFFRNFLTPHKLARTQKIESNCLIQKSHRQWGHIPQIQKVTCMWDNLSLILFKEEMALLLNAIGIISICVMEHPKLLGQHSGS